MAFAGVGLASAVVPRVAPPELPRCYWINPPLTHLAPVLMDRGVLDCRLARCQLTLRQTIDAGWVCFFERPWG